MAGEEGQLAPIFGRAARGTQKAVPPLSPLIFIKPEDQLPVPVEQENMLMAQGFEVPVHPQDDDQQHIQADGDSPIRVAAVGHGPGLAR